MQARPLFLNTKTPRNPTTSEDFPTHMQSAFTHTDFGNVTHEKTAVILQLPLFGTWLESSVLWKFPKLIHTTIWAWCFLCGKSHFLNVIGGLRLSISSWFLGPSWYHSVLGSEQIGQRHSRRERKPQATGCLSMAFLCPGSPASDLFRYFSICHESHCPMSTSQSTQRSTCGLSIKMSVQGWTMASASRTQPSPKMLVAVRPYILGQSPTAWTVLIPVARFMT